jgi:hypothetical protein
MIGNKNNIDSIKQWLDTFETSQYSNLLIVGPHGTCKTTISKLLFKEYNYFAQFLNFNEIKNNNKIKDYINVLLKGKDISKWMNGILESKRALIIDEIESITSTIEKNAIIELNKDNHKHKKLPIIFIANDQHSKSINKLKKNSLYIEFNLLNNDECSELFDLIVKNENINIKDNNIKNNIIDHSQGDPRKLITTLQNLYNMNHNNEINEEILHNNLSITKKKDVSISLFDSTQILLSTFLGIEKTIIMYENEKTNLPLMIHDHYIDEITTNFKNNKDKLQSIKKISDALSYGDYVEYHIYNSQTWDLQDIHGYFTCVSTSFHLNTKEKYNKQIELSFTEDLSKTSIRNINRKNIINIKSKFENANIYDYIYMNQIVKTLINNNQIKYCADILKEYNITTNNINTLIKIDKIRYSKNSELTSKNKKEFDANLNK